MSSLTIICYLDCDVKMGRKKVDAVKPPLVMKRLLIFEDETEPNIETDPWRVEAVELLRMSDRSSVFRATILRKIGDPLDAVLKLDHTAKREEAFYREAAAYETCAKNLQGSVVPFFYGLFSVEIGTKTVSCLVTQYCGSPLERDLYHTDHAFKVELLKTVDLLHRRGINHGDLSERNILNDNGRPVLVDLEDVSPHTCDLHLRVVQGALAPQIEEFGCAELHDLILNMGFWKCDEFTFYTAGLHKSDVDSVDYIKYFLPRPHSEKPDPWYQSLEHEAESLWETICQERLLTYGTSKLSECKTRLDML
ncbi:hypothetical protein B0H10DRAFT_2003130 [Mycena sp. CBHHK59/15]|nr:hypothetical protein B0H10DRAFT_2003130 [Mycena sp. CBHHK59/15]